MGTVISLAVPLVVHLLAITGKVETITSYTAMMQGLAIATGRRMRTIGHLLGDIMATGATAVVAAAGRAGGISGVPHTGIRVISRVHTMIHRHQRPRGPLLYPVTPPVPQTQPSSRDVQEKPVSTVDDDALVDNASATCKKSDQDHSLGSISWKPLKWTRSASISSLKTARSEVDESGREAKETPTRSSAASPQESEDGVAKKKQRLGWGQGLAKYEKQKVGGSDDGSTKNGLVPCDSSSKSTVSDTSPKEAGSAGCLSPVTRSSIACSSSPGVEDKPCVRASDPDTTDLSGSSIIDSQNNVKEFLFEHYEADPMGTLNKVLTDLLQPEDSCFGDSTFTRHTAISKLLLLKGDISKELEKTECDIDLFENELKSLDFDGNNNQCHVALHSTCYYCHGTLWRAADGTSVISFSSALVKDQQIASISTQVIESLDDCDAALKDAGSESSDTFSSKLGKASLGKAISDCDSQILAVSPLVEDVDFTDQAPDPLPPAADCIGRDKNDMEYANFSENSCGTGGSSLFSAILESNRGLKEEAMKGLPNDAPLFDFWKLGKLSSLQANDMLIKEKLASRKHRLKFKELALTLKYRAFHHLWAEDLRLLSIRKYRSKSQKRIEPSNRSSQSSSQKHRSSFRSRFALPAGNLTLVPTSEIVDYTKQLKSDSKLKVYRSNLKMPALNLDEESRKTVFVTHNGLIEDPIAFEKEKEMINPWMPEEREVFMEMLATWGKDFSKIASFLKHKTIADCVEFYYKNHKSDSFREVMKCLALRKQWQLPANNYLSTSGKRSQRDFNAVPLDMLEAVSMVAAHDNETTGNQRKFDQRPGFGSYDDFRMPGDAHGSVDKRDLLRHEKETTAADALAGIRGALSSEAMSPWIATSIGPAERINFAMPDRPLTPGVTQSIDEEEAFSDEGFGEFDSADWTDAEKTVFIQALSMYGKDFARISRCVASRTKEQCKIFFSKARKCLGLDILYQGPCNVATPRSDTNGGRSDTDDGFAAEMDSAVCSTQSCSRVDTEMTRSVVNTVGEDFAHAGNLSLQMEMDRSSEHHVSEGIDQEEIETKATDLDCDLNNDGLMRLGDDSRPVHVPKDASDAVVGSHGNVSSGGVAGFVADTELKKSGNCPAVSSSDTVSLEYVASDCLKLRTVEMTHGRSNEENCSNGTEMQDLDSVFVEGQGVKIGTDSNKSGSLCFETDPCANETASCLGNKVTACSSSIFPPNYHNQIQQDLLPSIQKRYLLNSLNQESSISVPVLPDPSSSSFGDPVHTGLQSNLIYEGLKQHENPVTGKLYQQYFLGSSTLNQISQTLQALTGYPLQSVDQQEFKQGPEMISGRSEIQQNCQNGNGLSPSSGIFDIGLHNLKPVDPKISHQRSEMLGSGRNDEQPNTLPKPCTQSFSENEEQSRQTGDVKLFGKILSNPSLQKSKSTSCESSGGKPPGQKRDSAQKPSNCQNDASAVASLSHSSRHSSPTDIPVRSYGYWDGNRIQTGFSSLPESAVLLTKLQGPLAGLSFYPTKDALPSNTRVRTEYQQAYTQPVSSGGTLPGFQQQGRTARQGNAAAVVGGGILGNGGGGGSGGSNAGGCTGVSDPVAAIKMHYARRAKLLASLESWRQTDR
ncbi:LOW QUALITY PROTEIN: uncharacterized protein LOC120264810 [Dioscorea cayenensis subsp. rotundata]|uniref:LOW QUALITY PROTEIN: uncharacterized protein LOC120264810 n=1 Tax=Dioscorea cayennensis subsp. rotundata TaxID=55577 RepID=A0AB40BNN2_DIOCR|nr:LOW QUALITY PROTEIN: uncharacterized protein LOC120264810 [Dioscorea cayenensis subsp. rotundata]